MESIVAQDWAPKEKKAEVPTESPVEEKEEIQYCLYFSDHMDNLGEPVYNLIYKFKDVKEILFIDVIRLYFKIYIITMKDFILAIKRTDQEKFINRCITYFYKDETMCKLLKLQLNALKFETDASLYFKIGTTLVDRYLDLIYESAMSNMFNACRASLANSCDGRMLLKEQLKAPSVKRLPTPDSESEREKVRKAGEQRRKNRQPGERIRNEEISDEDMIGLMSLDDIGAEAKPKAQPAVFARKLIEEMESLDEKVRDAYKSGVDRGSQPGGRRVREVVAPKEFVGARPVKQDITVIPADPVGKEEELIIRPWNDTDNPPVNEIRTQRFMPREELIGKGLIEGEIE